MAVSTVLALSYPPLGNMCRLDKACTVHTQLVSSVQQNILDSLEVECRAVEGGAVECRAVEGRAVEGGAVECRAVEGGAVECRAVEGRVP
jgi:hypothetical protein